MNGIDLRLLRCYGSLSPSGKCPLNMKRMD
jgi:hypothetical protein